MIKWPWIPRSWWEEERFMSKLWEAWYWQAERQKDDLLEQIDKMEKQNDQAR